MSPAETPERASSSSPAETPESRASPEAESERAQAPESRPSPGRQPVPARQGSPPGPESPGPTAPERHSPEPSRPAPSARRHRPLASPAPLPIVPPPSRPPARTQAAQLRRRTQANGRARRVDGTGTTAICRSQTRRTGPGKSLDGRTRTTTGTPRGPSDPCRVRLRTDDARVRHPPAQLNRPRRRTNWGARAQSGRSAGASHQGGTDFARRTFVKPLEYHSSKPAESAAGLGDVQIRCRVSRLATKFPLCEPFIGSS